MLISTAHLLALHFAIITLQETPLKQMDWHHQRGLSFLQIGLHALQQLLYQRCWIPRFSPLPSGKLLPAVASLKKKQEREDGIEFSRVTVFSF